VKVLTRQDGVRLEHPYEISLWDAREGQPSAVREPVDPAEAGIDPLSYL
jgi:hypothetical protein